MISCKGQGKIDLSKSILNEPIEQMINYDDKLLIGIETVEYPFCLLIENQESENYTFDGIDLKGQKIFFQINSEKLKTDSITRFGGGHINLVPLKSAEDLNENLKKFNADDKIYGVRIGIESQKLKTEVLKKLQSKYGKGTKNPNTDHGLYWNIKNENKFIFFAPDYERLIILNKTNLSKTCYWDTYNGIIDFGGCDNENYFQELVKNSTKPEDVKNKPIIKIDNNWNINELIVGKSTEEELTKSKVGKNLERMEEFELDENSENVKIKEIYYRDEYHDIYFYLNTNLKNIENKKTNIIKGYQFGDLKKVDISFENGLKGDMKFEEALKLFDKKLIKKTIINEGDLSFVNYIILKNDPYEVSLVFNEKMVFTGMFVK
jgi:hypothetical protein